MLRNIAKHLYDEDFPEEAEVENDDQEDEEELNGKEVVRNRGKLVGEGLATLIEQI